MQRRDILKMGMVGAGALALSAVNAQASAVDAKDVKFDEVAALQGLRRA